VGYQAGNSAQATRAIAVGLNAGAFNQGAESIAVGYNSGYTSQATAGTAVGIYSGHINQGVDGVAVGRFAGQTNQGLQAVAMGREAGATNQTLNAVAIGRYAGRTNQGSIGPAAGYAVAVGNQAGECNQGFAAVAVGSVAGTTTQGSYSVAVGDQAGYTNQGPFSIALGFAAGHTNQPANSIALNVSGSLFNVAANGFYVSGMRNTGYTYALGISSGGEISFTTSDDRMKDYETPIQNAVKAIMKLKPQKYKKRQSMESNAFAGHDEFGFMAQDVYYDVPEMRDLVIVHHQAKPTPEKPPAPSDDIRDDPDYSAWGPKPSSIMYDQLTPWLAKGIQEIVTELPRTKTSVSNTWGQSITGLIVSANTNKHKTNSIPIMTLSNVYLDKSWHGVVSEQSTDTNDYDTLIDVSGETRIWVTDIGGSFESGDLVTTSNISPGYGQKQIDDIIRSYTVAKITQDCDFTIPEQRPIMRVSQQLQDVTYYIGTDKNIISQKDYNETLNERHKKVTTETVYRTFQETSLARKISVYFNTTTDEEVDESIYKILPEDERNEIIAYEIDTEKYNTLSVEDKTLFTETTKNVYWNIIIHESRIPREKHTEEEIRQELIDVLDENGQIVWEETANTAPAYTLVDHGTYKAALVSCKLI
jgi:hypothetical protein